MTHGKSGENKSTEIRVSQNGAGDGRISGSGSRLWNLNEYQRFWYLVGSLAISVFVYAREAYSIWELHF